MEASYVDQLKLMQNRLINMEKAQPNHKNFPPKGSWVQKKTYHQDNRPPNQLESANMVEEAMPYYRPSDACYDQPCSCLCMVDPEWMVEGQATKEVEPRLPRLPNQWFSCQEKKLSCVFPSFSEI